MIDLPAMMPGLYALASLNGAPPDPKDCAVLGLNGAAGSQGLHHLPGMVLRIVEPDSRAVSIATQGPTTLAFLGHLDEPEDLMARLSLSGDPAHLALAALRAWGPEAGLYMPGEWSLLCWDSEARVLRLATSDRRRDRVQFAANGRHAAVAPDLRPLGRLTWTGLALDPTGFALAVGKAPLHGLRDGRTILRAVTELEPNSICVLTAEKTDRTVLPQPPLPTEPWKGSFEEAVVELEAAARLMMRQLLARHDRVAILLSGGLDSSLMAWLATQECRPGQSLFCLTSVAPDGSGLVDERVHAKAVAERLGLPVTFVTPEDSMSPCRPAPHNFVQEQGPSLSQRHYLYDSFFQIAQARGASALLDGVFGEVALTRRVAFDSPQARLRRWAQNIRQMFQGRRHGDHGPVIGFHARLSRQMLAALPPDILEQARPVEPSSLMRPDEMLGVPPLLRAAMNRQRTVTAFAGLRYLTPFRDPRLIRKAAPIPVGLTRRDGLPRAIARAILKDRVPDSIRLRTERIPFSPDFRRRLERDAATLPARIPEFRQAGAGDWLDLDWLEHAAKKMLHGHVPMVVEHYQLRTTAAAAEFLVWWSELDRT